jgi:hypothetical protein
MAKSLSPPEPAQCSIKEPIAAVFDAWDLLSQAVNAHLAGDIKSAAALFSQANSPTVWHWTNPEWGRPDLNVRVHAPDGDTQPVPKEARDPLRDLRHPQATQIRNAVLRRDGYRCRYCGIPVVDADIRRIARELYPDSIPWGDAPVQQHAAFQCFWLQYDHVVPHSHGGRSSEDNVVVCCALCNYGKDRYTLKQLGLSDPRLRAPEPVRWDGLERLRPAAPLLAARRNATSNLSERGKSAAGTLLGSAQPSFFIPGAVLRAKYVQTPPLGGKQRWFELGPEIVAEPAERNGRIGCRISCNPVVFRRRGLSPEAFVDEDCNEPWKENGDEP